MSRPYSGIGLWIELKNAAMDDVALLQRLLEIYSPTGQEAEAVRCLVDTMRAAGLEAAVDEAGNAVGSLGGGATTVMLLGHIDTVPGFIPVRLDGERLSGRGAVDAKGPLAAFVAAAVRVKDQLRGVRLVVVGAVGEEGDSRGARFIREHFRPDYTVIGEPSGWERVTLGYKGSAWFEYRARRELAHTAAAQESACEAAVSWWNRVTAWAKERSQGRERLFEQVSPTLREMNSYNDGFVETAEMRAGLRLPPGLPPAEVETALAGLAQEAEVRLLDGVPAYRAEKNTPLVRAFLAAIRGAGGQPGFTLKTGTSDMNVVAPAWGTPILAYGPGDSALDHTPQEHILLPEFRHAVDVLAAVLARL